VTLAGFMRAFSAKHWPINKTRVTRLESIQPVYNDALTDSNESSGLLHVRMA
jgi:hypothetical protein